MAAAAELAGDGDDDAVGIGRNSCRRLLLTTADPVVKTFVPRAYEMYNRPHEQRRHDRALTHTLYSRQEDYRQQARQHDQRYVESQFHISEILAQTPRDGLDEVFARHHGYIGLNLEGYAHREDHAPDQQHSDTAHVCHGVEP